MTEHKNPRMATHDALREELREVIDAGSFQQRDYANDGLTADDWVSLVETAGKADAGIDDAYPDPTVTATAQYPVKR